jgi:hypothetical protein
VRFKIVPEPPTHRTGESEDTDPGEECENGEPISIVRGQRAIPLVPASEEECCVRLASRLSLPARDAAREWLTFLRALDLVTETGSGFRRRHEDPDEEELAAAFRERIYGVREVLAVLEEADEPLSTDAVIERFAESIPQWERFRYPDPEAIWGERVERLLGWTVYFGLVEHVGERYRPADGSELL